MERIVQALFTTEKEAFKGLLAVQELAALQDISLGEYYVLSKDERGITSIRSAQDKAEGLSAISGGIVGGLVGMLAGPLGFLVGIGAGMVVGAAGDTVRAEGVSDLLAQMSANIPNEKSLLVLHVWEDWEEPINTVLEPLTSDIHRLNVNDDVFVPAESDLESLNKEITEAETAYLASDDEGKSQWNEKLLLLKIKREDLLKKLAGSTAHQERQYTTWVDNHHDHHADHPGEKHFLLQKRLADQKARLELLRKNR
jgi:uncharacterized membrane protein